MSNSRTIIVVGSANMDLVARVVRFPSPGETVRGESFATAPGGKGANQAVAAGRLGGAVEFVGSVGDDAFGSELRSSLEASGVRTTHLSVASGSSSGVATISVDANGQNAIVVVAGANGQLTPGHVRAAFAEIGEAAVVLVQLETPLNAVEAALEGARALGAFTILNPAPATSLTASLLCHVDVITPNETEALALVGILPVDDPTCAEAGRRLRALGPAQAVLTLGAAGCFWSHAASDVRVPSIQVQAVDTTAAGDAFNGALALALAERRPMAEALTWANRAGALCATRAGAQAAMPTRFEVDPANHTT